MTVIKCGIISIRSIFFPKKKKKLVDYQKAAKKQEIDQGKGLCQFLNRDLKKISNSMNLTRLLYYCRNGYLLNKCLTYKKTQEQLILIVEKNWVRVCANFEHIANFAVTLYKQRNMLFTKLHFHAHLQGISQVLQHKKNNTLNIQYFSRS